MPGNGTNLKKTVALVGMMGAGKTSIGKRLATRLDVPFADADHEIEAAADMTVAAWNAMSSRACCIRSRMCSPPAAAPIWMKPPAPP
jgi:ABC-type glutathione transport system ATPase component